MNRKPVVQHLQNDLECILIFVFSAKTGFYSLKPNCFLISVGGSLTPMPQVSVSTVIFGTKM